MSIINLTWTTNKKNNIQCSSKIMFGIFFRVHVKCTRPDKRVTWAVPCAGSQCPRLPCQTCVPKQAKHDQGWLFCAATWQVVNIKEEEGKYGLDLRILVFEQVLHLQGCRPSFLVSDFMRFQQFEGNTGHKSSFRDRCRTLPHVMRLHQPTDWARLGPEESRRPFSQGRWKAEEGANWSILDYFGVDGALLQTAQG